MGSSELDPKPGSQRAAFGAFVMRCVRPRPGSRRAIARQFVEQRVVPYSCCAPFVMGLIVAAIAWSLAPETLANDATHREWAGFFETSALVVGALVIGLVVEVREPFARASEPLIRIATAGTASLLAAAGVGAVVALIPTLTNWLYEALFSITLGGLVGGMLAVMAIGISASLRSLDEVGRQISKKMDEMGDR